MPPRPHARSRRPVFAALAALLVASVAAVGPVRAWLSPRPVPAAAAAAAAAANADVLAAPAIETTGEVRGRILDADGNAAGTARVHLVSTDAEDALLGEVTADAAGAFAFHRVPAGPVRVAAELADRGTVTSAVVAARAGQTTELTLVLTVTGSVRGTVVGEDDSAIEGATLALTGPPWAVEGATSDASGAFAMPVVPPGATALVASARGYRPVRIALAARDVRAGMVVRVKLSEAPPVLGRVIDPDASPAAGARVVACEGTEAEAQVVAGDDGAFELPGSVVGCVALAVHDDFAPSDPAAVAEGRRLTLRLSRGGAIEGAVVDERGAGVAESVVGIEVFAGAHGQSARTGRGTLEPQSARGVFRWDNLPPGTYVLSASAPGKAIARSAPITVAAGGAATGVRVVLSQGGRVVGHVVDADRAPVEGAVLAFDGASGVFGASSTATAKTDARGEFRLPGAPAGPFTIRVQRGGFRSRLVSGLSVASGAELVQDVTLSKDEAGTGLEFGGIGAGLAAQDSGLVFSGVTPGGPAERAGLRPGDRILRVDGIETDWMSLGDALQRLRGAPGTLVGITVARPAATEVLDVIVEREELVAAAPPGRKRRSLSNVD